MTYTIGEMAQKLGVAPSTRRYYELIDRRREAVLEQIAQLQDTLHTLDYKHWFYETALAAGTMDAPANMPLDQVPPKFRDMRKK